MIKFYVVLKDTQYFSFTYHYSYYQVVAICYVSDIFHQWYDADTNRNTLSTRSTAQTLQERFVQSSSKRSLIRGIDFLIINLHINLIIHSATLFLLLYYIPNSVCLKSAWAIAMNKHELSLVTTLS